MRMIKCNMCHKGFKWDKNETCRGEKLGKCPKCANKGQSS